MSAPKGGPKNGGRKKGTPNKSSASVKAAFLLAFDAAGGDKALAEWARDNRTEFYKLYAKLLPTESPANTHVNVNVVNCPDPATLTDAELRARIAALTGGTVPPGDGEEVVPRVSRALPS
jgi:hypothetical protein